jgi:hypothetical protein
VGAGQHARQWRSLDLHRRQVCRFDLICPPAQPRNSTSVMGLQTQQSQPTHICCVFNTVQRQHNSRQGRRVGTPPTNRVLTTTPTTDTAAQSQAGSHTRRGPHKLRCTQTHSPPPGMQSLRHTRWCSARNGTSLQEMNLIVAKSGSVLASDTPGGPKHMPTHRPTRTKVIPTSCSPTRIRHKHTKESSEAFCGQHGAATVLWSVQLRRSSKEIDQWTKPQPPG